MSSAHDTGSARLDIHALFDLTGDTAVVTGAGSGLGREMAMLLSAAGARVGLVDVSSARVEDTARRTAPDGGALALSHAH
jgi:NAD(P)-dependent dehydrogenase (short-subunit alcohol dehydrogenase family)